MRADLDRPKPSHGVTTGSIIKMLPNLSVTCLTRSPAICHPTLSIRTTAYAPGGMAWATSARKRFIAAAVSSGYHQRRAGIARRAYCADDQAERWSKSRRPRVATLPPDIAGAAGLARRALRLGSTAEALGFRMGRGNLLQARPFFARNEFSTFEMDHQVAGHKPGNRRNGYSQKMVISRSSLQAKPSSALLLVSRSTCPHDRASPQCPAIRN
jgi:hypothetical protein